MTDGTPSKPGLADVEAEFDKLSTDLNRQAFEPSPEGPGYHYCSTSAALAIISNGRLWATDLEYLNDPMEWRHGHDLAVNHIQSLLGSNQHDQTDRRLLEQLRHEVGERADRSFLVLVASLCESRDDPHLWERYGDNRRGCCLQIDTRKIPDAIVRGDSTSGGAAVGRVWYDDTRKNDLVGRAVTRFLDLARVLRQQHDQRDHPVANRWCSVNLQIHIGLLATAFKENRHASERELRLVQMKDLQDTSVNFRVTNDGKAAPYSEIDVSDSIREIQLGSAHPASAVAHLQEWLRRRGRRIEVSPAGRTP